MNWNENIIVRRLWNRRDGISQRALGVQNAEEAEASLDLTAIAEITASGLNALSPTQEDADRATALAQRLKDDSDASLCAYLYLCLGMYVPPYRSPFLFDLRKVGGDLCDALAGYLTHQPLLFSQAGDPERYVEFGRQLYTFIAECLRTPAFALFPEDTRKALIFRFSGLPALCSEENLKDFMSTRARALEAFVAVEHGHDLMDDSLEPLEDVSDTAGTSSTTTLRLFGTKNTQSMPPRVCFIVMQFRDGGNTNYVLPHMLALASSGMKVSLFSFDRTTSPEIDAILRSHGIDHTPLDRLSFRQQVNLLREGKFDLAVFASNVVGRMDLTCRLASVRLATRHLMLGANPATTGFRHSALFLTARSTESKDLEIANATYTEKPLLLDEGLFCVFSPRFALGSGVKDQDRQEIRTALLGDHYDTIAFSNANILKITPVVLSTWMEILQRAPRTRLVLAPFNPAWSDAVKRVAVIRQLLHDVAQSKGVSPDRVVLLRPGNLSDIRTALAASDLYLDTWPFTSCTSLIWPILHGIPYLSMESPDAHSQRMHQGPAIARELGLESLITSSIDAYRDFARQLLIDPEARATAKAQLLKERNRCSIFDVATFGRRFTKLVAEVVEEADLGAPANLWSRS